MIKKRITITLSLLISMFTLAQVGINTETPKATVDIVGNTTVNVPDGVIAPRLTGDVLKSKDANYTVEQTGAIIYATAAVTNGTTAKTVNVTSPGYYYFDGAIWQELIDQVKANNGNNVDAASKNVQLGGTLIKNTSIDTNSKDLSLLNLSTIGNANSSDIVVLDANDVVRKGNIKLENIPKPAYLELPTSITVLNGSPIGSVSPLPFDLKSNAISGFSYDKPNSRVFLPNGIYQFTFVYEGEDAACTLSSYFMDFPLTSGSTRVHSTAAHNSGGTSNHGGSIIFTTTITTPRYWSINIGRGQSGNCSGSTSTIFKGSSTHMLIFKIGDA